MNTKYFKKIVDILIIYKLIWYFYHQMSAINFSMTFVDILILDKFNLENEIQTIYEYEI
jgi:hypothetical protein